MGAISRSTVSSIILGGMHRCMQDIANKGIGAFVEPAMFSYPEAGNFYLSIGELPVDNVVGSIRKYYGFAFITDKIRYPIDILDLIAYDDSVAIRCESIETHIYSKDGSLMDEKSLKKLVNNIITATPELRKLCDGKVK